MSEERTVEEERAVSRESTVEQERAVLHESTAEEERAAKTESTDMDERAARSESTVMAERPPVEVSIPGTNELVSLEDARACALALESVRDVEARLRSLKQLLSESVAREAAHQGVRSIELPDGRRAYVTPSTETEYDPEALETGLREAGMPEQRIREIVKETVTYKVSAAEAKKAANANPQYAEAVEASKQTKTVIPRVSIKTT